MTKTGCTRSCQKLTESGTDRRRSPCSPGLSSERATPNSSSGSGQVEVANLTARPGCAPAKVSARQMHFHHLGCPPNGFTTRSSSPCAWRCVSLQNQTSSPSSAQKGPFGWAWLRRRGAAHTKGLANLLRDLWRVGFIEHNRRARGAYKHQNTSWKC